MIKSKKHSATQNLEEENTNKHKANSLTRSYPVAFQVKKEKGSYVVFVNLKSYVHIDSTYKRHNRSDGRIAEWDHHDDQIPRLIVWKIEWTSRPCHSFSSWRTRPLRIHKPLYHQYKLQKP